jgi:hypothetical protein
MKVVVVTSELAYQLCKRQEPVEIRDEAGNLLGRFQPEIYEIPDDLGLTEEELERRMAPDAKTHTTAEVLAYLKGLVRE